MLDIHEKSFFFFRDKTHNSQKAEFMEKQLDNLAKYKQNAGAIKLGISWQN